MSDKGLKRLLILAATFVSAGALTGILIATSGAASTWNCRVTGQNGGTHNFTVQADDAAGALQACKDAWVNSATYQVTGGTTTSTSSTSSTTTSSTTSTTSTTTIPPGPGYPAIAPPFRLNGDFNNCGPLLTSGGWNVNEAGSDHPGSVAIESTQVGEGPCGAKYQTPAGSGTGRAELQMPTLSTPVTLDYEQLFYIPSKANGGPDHGYLSQTKQNNNPCSNGGASLNKADRHLVWSTAPSCSAGTTKWDLGPVPLDHWFAIHTLERFADAGSLKVWLDDDGTGPLGYVLKLDKPSLDTLSGTGVKLRQGIYHDQDPYLTTVFADGFHVAG